MSEETTVPLPGYWQYVRTANAHTLAMLLRRPRIIMAAALVLTPVLIPLAMAFLSEARFRHDGNQIFVKMTEYLYLKSLAPVLALFFGCMLVGEDVESQALTYLLVRPAPRSALVLGRFLAFLILGTSLFIPAIFLIFAACTALGNLSFSWPSLKLMLHYDGVLIMALLGYGPLCMLFGALVRRAIVLGLVVIFGWQRLAMVVPGYIDFLTIEKYVNAMLPRLAGQRENVVFRTALAEFHKREFLVGASKAAITLLVISVVLLCLTSLVVRWREFTAARAVGG